MWILILVFCKKLLTIIIVGATAQNNELGLGPVRGGNVAQRSTF